MKAKLLSLLLFLLASSFSLFAQEPDLRPWTENPYGNEWIDYSKKYVRVGIVKDGMYRIPLATLQSRIEGLTAANVQCWFRGRQIALQIDGGNVVFYGRKNDGASDGLMFRNDAGTQIDPSQRLNTHDSFYSEEGAHFFTTAKGSDILERITLLQALPSGEATFETYHTEKFVQSAGANYRANQGDREGLTNFAFRASSAVKELNNSYFQRVNAFLEGTTKLPAQFTLTGYYPQESDPVVLEFSFHGDALGSRNVEVFVARNEAELVNNRVFQKTYANYSGEKTRLLLSSQNLTSLGSGYIRFSNSGSAGGASFYSFSYPQSLSLAGNTNKRYYFKEGIAGKRRISITEATADIKVYDISSPDTPQLINGSFSGTSFVFDINRLPHQALVLQVVTENGGIISDENIHPAAFDLLYSSQHEASQLSQIEIESSVFDYLIITHSGREPRVNTNDGMVKDGAIAYGVYRGKQYRTLVITTRSIYDRFNYGEPSPIAISRFVDFMIRDGIRNDHNVLLVGHGVGRPPRIVKELPYDVPTYGNPGSDILLVSNLSNDPNSHIDIPSVPIGRIVAFNQKEVDNYLSKVEQYELQTKSGVNLQWRKKLINLIGLKTSNEPTIFNRYVDDAQAQIDQAKGPWEITRISNETHTSWPPTTGDFPITNAPIDNLINSGVGMLGYYGHGDFSATNYNIGSASRYTQSDKRYPFVFITGCGVGDVYDSHNPTSATSNIANTWINVKDKGAIAVLANTFLAYTSTAAGYMQTLYGQIFRQDDSVRRPIGQIQMNVAKLIILGSDNARISAATPTERANIHQIALLGDPAVRILLTSDVALPVSYLNFSGITMDNGHIKLNWETSFEQNNDRFIVERSGDGKTFQQIGVITSYDGESNKGKLYDFTDISPEFGVNYYRLKQVDLPSNGSQNSDFSYSQIISVKSSKSEDLTILNLYPNPATDFINISFLDNVNLKQWEVIDLAGRRLLNGTSSAVNLSSLSPGVFIIEITQKNGETIRKQILKY